MRLCADYVPGVCLPGLREVGWTLVEEGRIQCPIGSWETNLPPAGKRGSMAEGKGELGSSPFSATNGAK